MPDLSVLAAGSSGFLGTHLIAALRERGHRVSTLTRSASTTAQEFTWDPYAGLLDQSLVESCDVVVNLAGSPLIGNPHSKKWAQNLRESRVRTTSVLAQAIAASDRKPAFLAGNGISVYGDHGEQVLTEDADSRGHALLTEVTQAWESAASPAADAGARVCILRTAPVMDRSSEPLKELRRLFQLGLGGKLGDGRQHMPMISLRDWVGGVVHLAESADASGPFNLCCPVTPTNEEFTKTLAGALGRPSFATVPAPVLRLVAGPMAPEVLGSVNVRPAALERSGYEFADRDVHDVLAAGLG